MAVIQAFNRERAFQAEFDGLNEDNRLANVRVQKIYSVFFPAIELLGAIATVAVLFAGAQLIEAGSLEIGTLIAAVGLLALVFQPLQELSELYGQVQAASAAMDKISSVLDAEIDVADKPGARPTRADRRPARARPRHVRVRRGAGAARDRDRRAARAAASLSSASRAAASRRPRS